jgi:hypothetical protein
MGDYLKLSGGVPTDANANAASAGAADAGKLVKLDAGGKIDPTQMPAGIGAETRVMVASEALAAGDLVNIHSSSGAKVRKADATSAGKEAHGFVLGAVANGANATVYPEENVIERGRPGRVNAPNRGLAPAPPVAAATFSPSAVDGEGERRAGT